MKRSKDFGTRIKDKTDYRNVSKECQNVSFPTIIFNILPKLLEEPGFVHFKR